jgi:superfamily II DNA or RNA helicase
MLIRSGYIVEETPEIKKELTVRAVVNSEFGFPPPPFKVFRKSKKGLCVPRFYGLEKFGPPVEDRRPEPTMMSSNVKFLGKLRDETFQNEALRKGIEAGHGILSLDCGFGKTVTAIAMACSLGYRTMIVVHKEFLANQWEEKIKQFCPNATIGRVQQNKLQVDCDFVVAMLQSLSTKEYEPTDFDSIGTLIIDEAHHICAKVFSQSLFKLCPKHIYGLSATPERKDGLTKVLHWFIGPTFFSAFRENQKQVEVFPIKYECPLYNEMPPLQRNGKLSLVNMITELVEHPGRNAMIVKLVRDIYNQGRKLLVLSDRRFHCEFLHNKFSKSSGLYMGGMKQEKLDESAEKSIIFATFSQAHEGLDIPALDTVILATPKSDIKQSVGRILRETPGKKNDPHIYDIIDNWSILNAMYYKRSKVYRDCGFNVPRVKGSVEEVRDSLFSTCLIE